MFFYDKRLQYPVTVDTPNPAFARMLQQAIGGVEGEIRVCMQYFFQAWGARGPAKYRDMLMNTATEEIGHIEMLATAVALNLEGAPVSLQEEISKDPIAGSVLNGMDPRHILSTGLSAYPANAAGVPFDMSHIYASGNIAADMYCNVAAEATGRVLAVRLYNFTNDPGMKHMLAFNIARDTMHQQQWLAVLEELGPSHLPIPNSFPQSKENSDFAYNFMISDVNGIGTQANQPWTSGKAPDGHGEFSIFVNKPIEDAPAPDLGFGRPDTFGQKEQANGTAAGLVNKGKDLVERLTKSND
ncbi:MAG TPA: manganese catalase family protein [Acidobacteriaceae bacterium]|nr:manganese catalase family protein [Acidobacteriaceae bacterium]